VNTRLYTFACHFPSFVSAVCVLFLAWVAIGTNDARTLLGACAYCAVLFLPVSFVCSDCVRRLGADRRA
jgi:uncharacterized membrane protein